ncbi:hypothetical protein JCGZ_08858 [Jatropha curcas]|uniref:Cathepsin propeptide inhibitor domain-containing protein n=1 Tax=Jatropha curcas TaxID=180498 RepID=A0A067JJU6_JATCU|nr:hypothetical protein JCGZ_08858 [Jatropha curcas]
MGLWAFQGWSPSLSAASMEERHEMWMAQHGRDGNKPYKLGINAFADLTNEEFRASPNGYKKSSCSISPGTKSFRRENVTSIPSSLEMNNGGIFI